MSLPVAKGVWPLPAELEGNIEVIGFDPKTAKLTVREKIAKKHRGKTPEGYEASVFGQTYHLTERDSCLYWLKPDYSFLIVSWSWDQTKQPAQLVLTIDYWRVK